jgi:hypothetical protein
MPQLLELAGPLMRRCTRFHTNEARRRQIGKELKNSRSTNTPADHHRPTDIDPVNLKHRFREDRENPLLGHALSSARF